MLQKGLKVFGNKGHEASMKEIDQLHRRDVFCTVKGRGNETFQEEESTNGTHVPHRDEG
jgi:hypothetical protein